MPTSQQSPGFVEALIRRLRDYTGLAGQQDPSVAGAANTLQQLPQQRAMQIKAAEQGMSPEEYQMMLQQQNLR